MTAPRQYTDAADPNLIPADEVRQPNDEFGAPAQTQRLDQDQPLGQGQQFDQPQHLDPSAQQFSPPPVTGDPALHGDAGFRSADTTQASTPQAVTTHESSSGDALFAEQDLSELRTRWNDVQASFVDDPRDCVQQADGLVSSAVEQLTAGFAHTRSRLEEQWSRGEEASTEDLRVALKQYRDFFDRLLAV
jgi:hypothetical protein